MEHLIQLDTPAEFEHYKDVAGAPALDREKIKADAPDVTLLLVGPGSRLRGSICMANMQYYCAINVHACQGVYELTISKYIHKVI